MSETDTIALMAAILIAASPLDEYKGEETDDHLVEYASKLYRTVQQRQRDYYREQANQ